MSFHSQRRYQRVKSRGGARSVQAQAPVIGLVTEYTAPATTAVPVIGPDGNIWFNASPYIGVLDLATNTVQYFPTGISGLMQDLVLGGDGNVYFGVMFQNVIGQITPDGTVSLFSTTGTTMDLVAGPDGRVWFGEGASVLGAVTTAGVVSEYTTSCSVGPLLVADGNIWFGESCSKIGFSTTGGAITEFDTLAPTMSIAQLADGNIWFGTASISSGSIGNANTNGVINEFTVENGAFSTVMDANGVVWFGSEFTDQIGALQNGSITYYDISGLPAGVIIGPDGNPWFTEFTTAVGTIAGGTVTEFPTVGDTPYPPIVAGGNVWYGDNGGMTAPANGYVGTVMNGAAQEFVTNALPNGLLVGPAGLVVYFGEDTARFGSVVVAVS